MRKQPAHRRHRPPSSTARVDRYAAGVFEFTQREKRISIRELVRCRTHADAISSIRPSWYWRRYLSGFERSPALDQGEGRTPSAGLGQLALGLAAQRGELVGAQCLKQPRLQRDAELKRKTQIGVAWFERHHVRVDLCLLHTDLAEQFRKSAARLAAQGGKGLRQQSDQSLGRGRWRIEVPRAQVPLLQNQ